VASNARDARHEAGCADAEHEVQRAVDDEDGAAVGGEPVAEARAGDPLHGVGAAPGEVASRRDGARQHRTVAAPEDGERHGAHHGLGHDPERGRIGEECETARTRGLPRRARDHEAADLLRMARGDRHGDVAAQRQPDEHGPAAGGLVDGADHALGRVVELERPVALRAVPRQVDGDAPEAIGEEVELWPPHRATHQRAVDEHDRRGALGAGGVPGRDGWGREHRISPAGRQPRGARRRS
jgi:hypothetical protein